MAYNGLDIYLPYTFSVFQCLGKSNANYFVVRAFRVFGTVDHNATQSLRFIKQLGLKADIYMSLCRGKNAAVQVHEMMDAVPSHLYDMVWINVEQNPAPGCDWAPFGAEANCNFLISLIEAVKSRGKNVGIYSSYTYWQIAFKSIRGCPQVASQPLWYLYDDHIKGVSPFPAFGGWSIPTMKKFYRAYQWCDVVTDLDYRVG